METAGTSTEGLWGDALPQHVLVGWNTDYVNPNLGK